MPAILPESFYIEPNTRCWLWLGRIDRLGYGKIGKSSLAHRVLYTQYKGEIPEGYDVDHLCQTAMCVNPDHLEAVTHAENQKRWGARLRFCKYGHPKTDQNIYVDKRGARRCRVCARIWDKIRRPRKT